jgi:hypothetical protein
MANLRRPKSDGRCIHCRQKLQEKTKDHVFPDSWYPASTPANVQRWTVPSCGPCNGDSGQLENEVFLPLALCINPQKNAAAGLSKKALRAFGIDADGQLSDDEKRIRRGVQAKIFEGAEPYLAEVKPHVLPGLGPHPQAPDNQQLQIFVPDEKLQKVFKKIVRGCEYWFADGRIVEPPYEVNIYVTYDADVPDVVRTFARFGSVYLGPGFRVRRAAAHDEPPTVLYEIVLWDTLKYFGLIDRDGA